MLRKAVYSLVDTWQNFSSFLARSRIYSNRVYALTQRAGKDNNVQSMLRLQESLLEGLLPLDRLCGFESLLYSIPSSLSFQHIVRRAAFCQILIRSIQWLTAVHCIMRQL